jgi:orotate phosphoribosyltransferase
MKRLPMVFVQIIRKHFPDAEVIAGAATGGILNAAWVSQKMNLPMIYVRSNPKDYGKGSQIEGRLQTEQKVVVIEDLVSTGGSSLNVAKAV